MILARLHESTESYCCHAGLGVGVLYIFETLISQQPLARPLSYLEHNHIVALSFHHITFYLKVRPGMHVSGVKNYVTLILKVYDKVFVSIYTLATTIKKTYLELNHIIA